MAQPTINQAVTAVDYCYIEAAPAQATPPAAVVL